VSAALDSLVFRAGTAADADRLAAVMVAGYETFHAFAPSDFQVPTAEEIAEILRARLDTPPVWSLLAEEPARVAGYVTLLPAADSRRPVDDPGLAHFWMLFVRAEWWGTGLAGWLQREAVAAATARGYTAMRLFTPAGQVRARRFYEREGWTLASEPHIDEDLRLELVEYRKALLG
jgi:GNAT superfamily N-acetyltransferase